MSNSTEFIDAYNRIDNSLRARFNFSDRMSYSDVVRKSAELSSLVRKYESDLISYGRLRNAIVHDSSSNFVIAEPHDKVVQNYVKIADLLEKPPKVSQMEKPTPISLSPNMTIFDAVKLMYESGYSNMPVFDGKKIYGLVTGRHIVYTLGRLLERGIDVESALSKARVSEIIFGSDYGKIYVVKNIEATLDEIVDEFEKNRKLFGCIITNSGTLNEKPIKIFTSVDIIKIKKVLEDY